MLRSIARSRESVKGFTLNASSSSSFASSVQKASVQKTNAVMSSSPPPSSSAGAAVAEDDDDAFDAYFSLRRAWINESNSPDLLPYCDAEVERLRAATERQEELLEGRTTIADVENCKWQDLNRAKYVLRSYLRVRVKKIELLAMHCLKRDQGVDSPSWKLMSEKERAYCKEFTKSGEKNAESVLERMPAKGYEDYFRSYVESKSDMEYERWDMMRTPRTDARAFFRMLKDVGDFRFVDENGEDFVLDLKKGDIFCAKYEDFKSFLSNDDDRNPRAELV